MPSKDLSCNPESNEENKINSLSNEMLFYVASFLNKKSDFTNFVFALGKEKNNEIGEDPLYWRNAFKKDFPVEFKRLQQKQRHLDITKQDYKNASTGFQALKASTSKLDKKYQDLFIDISRNNLEAIQHLNFSVENLLGIRDQAGFNPISWAVHENRLNILAYFYEKACRDIFSKGERDQYGLKKLSWAFLCCQENVVNALIEKDKSALNNGATIDIRTLYFAAQSGNLRAVQNLLEEEEVDVNLAPDGYSPLFAAALNGHFGVVQCLIEHGADVNQRNRKDLTPVMIAIKNGHFDVVQYLLECGAVVPKTKAFDGETLYSIAERCYPKIYNLLILHNQDEILSKRISTFLGIKRGNFLYKLFNKSEITPEQKLVKDLEHAKQDINTATEVITNYRRDYPGKLSQKQYETIMQVILEKIPAVSNENSKPVFS